MQTMNTMKLQRSAPAAAGVQRPVPQMAAGFPGTSRRRASVVRGATNNATNGGKGKDFDFDAFATQANGKLKEWGEQAQVRQDASLQGGSVHVWCLCACAWSS